MVMLVYQRVSECIWWSFVGFMEWLTNQRKPQFFFWTARDSVVISSKQYAMFEVITSVWPMPDVLWWVFCWGWFSGLLNPWFLRMFNRGNWVVPLATDIVFRYGQLNHQPDLCVPGPRWERTRMLRLRRFSSAQIATTLGWFSTGGKSLGRHF